MWAALLGSGLTGALVALQSRINGGLSQSLGDAYIAAAVSFGSGLLILAVAVLLSARARAGFGRVRAEIRSRRLPWWTLAGGACGAFFVVGQGIAASVIGVALFTVGVVAGQVLSGLILDRIGLGPGGRVDPTIQRIVGTVLAIAAVLLAVQADLGEVDGRSGRLWLIVVPIVAGVLVAWQSAVNGILRAATYSSITPAFISFAVGTAVLVVAVAVSVTVNGWPEAWPADPLLYIGGAIGALFVAVAVLLVRTAGVLLLSMSSVAGQLLAAVAFDIWLPLGSGVTGWLLAGAAVALLAVTIAAVPGRPVGRIRARARSGGA